MDEIKSETKVIAQQFEDQLESLVRGAEDEHECHAIPKQGPLPDLANAGQVAAYFAGAHGHEGEVDVSHDDRRRHARGKRGSGFAGDAFGGWHDCAALGGLPGRFRFDQTSCRGESNRGDDESVWRQAIVARLPKRERGHC